MSWCKGDDSFSITKLSFSKPEDFSVITFWLSKVRFILFGLFRLGIIFTKKFMFRSPRTTKNSVWLSLVGLDLPSFALLLLLLYGFVVF